MRMSRRQFGALTTAAVLVPDIAEAADPNVLVTGWDLPANLDPHQVLDVPSQNCSLNLYDNLYRYEDNPPTMQPWLAESHTVSDDGLNWEFKLRAGVKFHDGNPVTADDVVYSARRLLAIGKAPAAPFLPILKPDNVSAPDPQTVRFKLERPYGPFLSAIPLIAIVNAEQIKPHENNGDWGAGWLSSNEAGSGAYRLVPQGYVPLEQVDMTRNEDHFKGWSDNPRPITRVQLRPSSVTSTRVLALLNGSSDATDTYIPVDQVERIAKSPGVHVTRNLTMRIFVIRMNNKKPPFDNLNARKGFAHAFNYPGFIDEILHGNAQRDPVPLPNNIWGFPKDIAGYDYDLDKAKDFFKKAAAEGAPLHRPIDIHILQQLEQTTQAAQVFQADLATLDINAKIVNDTFANVTTSCAKVDSTPDMWIHWVSTYFVDPENWVGQMYDSQFHGTWKASCWYENPKVDALLRQARALVGQDTRAPLYEEATRLIVADSPDIWIYNTIELCGWSNRVEGYRFCPVGSGSEVRWMHLKA